MNVTVRQLAELVHGSIVGDPQIAIHGARTLQQAQAGDISFLEHPKYQTQLEKSKASAIIVEIDFPVPGKTLIQVADPLGAFIIIAKHLKGIQDPQRTGISPKADVHPDAAIGADPTIHAFASIGEGSSVGDRCRIHSGVVIGRNCRLGHDVVLYPNVVLYDDTILGDRVIIHANSVLGSDGFGYRLQQGRHVKVPQLGNVEIGADVEIGACTTIDRGTFQTTTIGAGTKIDNLVQIAHNVSVGQHNFLVSQTGIAGSSSTGQYVVLGGQVGVADHVHIGDGVLVGARSAVYRDIPAGQRLIGSPAEQEIPQKRVWATLPKIPAMHRAIRKIQQHLGIAEKEV